MTELEIHYADDWAALYVDGKLETVGDSYLAEERAFTILGVKTVQDDAFMRGQTKSSGVASTLKEVREYIDERHSRQERADRLMAQAAQLRDQAEALIEEAERIETA